MVIAFFSDVNSTTGSASRDLLSNHIEKTFLKFDRQSDKCDT